MRRNRVRARTETGAAAVEAGLVTTFLMPLVVGVLFYGNWFWHQQDNPVHDLRVPQAQVVGLFTCAQLVDRVKQTVVANAGVLDLVEPLELSDVAVDIVEVLPTVGAVVNVSIVVESDTNFDEFLPNEGDVVSELTMRLEHVSLTTETCL